MALIYQPADEQRRLMPPPPARRPQKRLTALPEEDYAESIGAIIERDYFPDIPKMQNQLDWLQATSSGDPMLIRQAQLNIARRRAGLKTQCVPSTHPITPGTWATPGTNVLRTPSMTPLMASTPRATETVPVASTSGNVAHGENLRAPPMPLDHFFSQYTSEDNASFQDLQEAESQRKKAKFAHHLEDKNTPLLLEGPFSTDEYGTSGQQPGTLIMARHVPKNILFYDSSQRPAAALTEKEIADRSKGPAKGIQLQNTRIARVTGVQDTGALHPSQGVVGVNGSAASDLSILATPNLTPGMEASPFMTWGEINSTPLRLDVDDLLPLDKSSLSTPSFHLSATPKRELVGRQLAARAAASLAATKKPLTPAAAAARAASTPLLSPAARRLASNLRTSGTRASSVDVSLDKQLRASYSKTPSSFTPSPAHRHGSVTPRSTKHTPQAKGSSIPVTLVVPKRPAPAGAPVTDVSEGLTDNLLAL